MSFAQKGAEKVAAGIGGRALHVSRKGGPGGPACYCIWAGHCAARSSTRHHETPCDRRHTGVLTEILTTRLAKPRVPVKPAGHRLYKMVSEGTRIPDAQDRNRAYGCTSGPAPTLTQFSGLVRGVITSLNAPVRGSPLHPAPKIGRGVTPSAGRSLYGRTPLRSVFIADVVGLRWLDGKRLTIFNCEGYRRGAGSRPGLARKPSRRPGRQGRQLGPSPGSSRWPNGSPSMSTPG